MSRLPALAIGAAALAGAGWYLASGDPSEPGLTPVPAAHAQAADGSDGSDAAATSEAEVAEMTLGDPQAEVQVIEYASFTCPHCANFHDTVWPELKETYVDTGRIGFTYREVYFDRYGLWAGMLARCGGDTEKYFAIADMIYDRQRDWAQGEPAEIADNLRRIGKTAGLTDERLDACMADGAKAEAMVATFERNAEADEVTSTPSFLIDGEQYSNMSYEDFAAILDEKLGEGSDG